MKYSIITSLLLVSALQGMSNDTHVEMFAPPWSPICKDSQIPDSFLWNPQHHAVLPPESQLTELTPHIPAAADHLALATQVIKKELKKPVILQASDDDEYLPSSQTRKKKSSANKLSVNRYDRNRHRGNFPCKLCHKVLAWSWGLAAHLKHSCPNNPKTYNLRLYPCTIQGCTHRAKRQSDLNRHMTFPHPPKRPMPKLKLLE